MNASKHRIRAIAAIILATLAILEGGLRAWVLISRAGAAIVVPRAPELGSIMVSDPATLWAMRPNVGAFSVEAFYEGAERVALPAVFRVSTDALGTRAVPGRPDAPRRRILALGDSTTFGLGVDDADAWPARLQALANARRPAGQWGVYNAGVTGHSIAQSARALRRLAPALRPDFVVLTAGNNDPTVSGPLGDRADLDFQARLSPLAITPVAWTVARHLRAALAVPSDRHPPRVSLPEFRETLAEIAAYCADHGIELLLVRWPWRDQTGGDAPPGTQPHLAYQQALLDAAPPGAAIDLLPRFAAETAPLYFDPVHVGPGGNALVAQAVWAVIEARHAPPPPE